MYRYYVDVTDRIYVLPVDSPDEEYLCRRLGAVRISRREALRLAVSAGAPGVSPGRQRGLVMAPTPSPSARPLPARRSWYASIAKWTRWE